MGRLDKWASQYEIQIRHVETESGQSLSALDVKTRMLLEEMQRALAQFRSAEVAEREKLEMRMSSQLERLLHQRDARMVGLITAVMLWPLLTFHTSSNRLKYSLFLM